MLHFRDSRDGSIDLSGAHPFRAGTAAGRPCDTSVEPDPRSRHPRRCPPSCEVHPLEGRAAPQRAGNPHGSFGDRVRLVDGEGRQVQVQRSRGHAPHHAGSPWFARRGLRDRAGQRDHDQSGSGPASQRRSTTSTCPSPNGSTPPEGPHGFDPGPALDRLRDLAQSVPGLRINHRLIISTFANIASPFSTDHLPTQHPVLRALAGDEEVRAALGGPSYVPQRDGCRGDG
jgi:hypothetical protein